MGAAARIGAARHAQDAVGEDDGVRDRVQRAKAAAAPHGAHLLRKGAKKGARRSGDVAGQRCASALARYATPMPRHACNPRKHAARRCGGGGAASRARPNSCRENLERGAARPRAARAAGGRTESGARNMVLDSTRPSDGATTLLKVSPPEDAMAAGRGGACGGAAAARLRRGAGSGQAWSGARGCERAPIRVVRCTTSESVRAVSVCWQNDAARGLANRCHCEASGTRVFTARRGRALPAAPSQRHRDLRFRPRRSAPPPQGAAPPPQWRPGPGGARRRRG